MATTSTCNCVGRTRAEAAVFVIEQIRSMGREAAPASRLVEMSRIWNRGYVDSTDPDFPTALEAMRDIQQLSFVFDHMQGHRENAKFRDLVKLVVADSRLPQEDTENSPGRDAQFELYLGAICQRAGLIPVEYIEPPDITCTITGQKYGIAAKRLKSDGGIRRHVRKAARQIDASGCPGVIAIELSLAWNRENSPITSSFQSQLYPLIAQARGHGFLERRGKDIQRWIADSNVIGVVLFEFQARVVDGKWAHAGMMSWLDVDESNEERNQNLARFRDAFASGFPGLIDSDTKS